MKEEMKEKMKEIEVVDKEHKKNSQLSSKLFHLTLQL